MREVLMLIINVKNVKCNYEEQFIFHGSTVSMHTAHHHSVQAPSYVLLQHSASCNINRKHVRARKCGLQHADALQRSAPSAATSQLQLRLDDHTLRRVCDDCQDLIWRDAWGGVVWNQIAARSWNGNEAVKGPKW